MLEISRIGCAVYLCILSVIDIWTRRIPLWFLAAGGAAAAAARICQTGTLDFSALAGAVTGAVFIVVSRVTREGISRVPESAGCLVRCFPLFGAVCSGPFGI